MKRQLKAALFGSVALAAMAATTPAMAQETSSSIRGTVVSQAGSELAGVTVEITHVPSGTTRTFVTNSDGVFYARGLRVGGPYIVKLADGTEYQANSIEDVFLSLGRPTPVTLVAAAAGSSIEEITVTASAVAGVPVALGPSSTYDLSDLENAPAINRDIKDVIRQDPRVYIDETFEDSVQCAGANPRFNSLTVDGVGLNDNFGLNSNGFPTTRIPFSFDAIQQVAVELAPFDVEYGAFTACNINAVTKSGTNEFHGGAFFDYSSDGLQGKNLEGEDPFDIGDFSEKRYGATLGGPIIKDKLFFFAAYEKLEGSKLFDRGPAGSGAARIVQGVSQEQLDRIVDIAKNIYGYDPGTLPGSLPVSDEKILAKIDWNINDNHRLALTYNYNDGFTIAESDGDDDELELSNHYYERGTKLESYAGSLFSDWTDRLSTELRVSYADIDNRQISLGGTDFGEVQITTYNDYDNDGVRERATVYLGADDSRQSNKLAYTTFNMKLAANYQLDNHFLTFGAERIEFDIFNLFIQESQGEFRFRDNSGLGFADGIDAFEAGRPERVIYENAAPTNNPDDAAANFKYAINTVYAQDEFALLDGDLQITAGLRYDWYTSNDVPTENPNFVARNGFSNASNFDGRGLVMPRFGFTYLASDRMEVHGGIGIYSGGNPNVWLSNNYSNNGITQVEAQARDYDDSADSPTLFTDPTVGGEDPIYGIPQRLYDAVANGSANSGVNAVDPNFKIPSQLKVALGTVIDFDMPAGLGEDFRFQADVLYSKNRNSARIMDNTLVQIGNAPDGRPMYASVDKSDADCVADPTANPFGCNRWFNNDYILTNADGGRQWVFSAALSKEYDNGIDWTLAYAYTDATDVAPMTSSVAFSNFSLFATSDRNNPTAARSNYVIPHRFTAKFTWQHDFWDDNTTRLTLFGSYNQGRPYSFTFVDMGGAFNGNFTEIGDGVDGGSLLYIPTGTDDPLVNFGENFDTDAFFAYLQENGLMKYAGEIAPRNSNFSDWWGKIDLKFEQELPAFAEGHKMSAFVVIENLTNLIDSDWGVAYQASFPRMFQIVAADITDGKYNYNEFFERDQGRVTAPSTWEVRFGVKYKF